MELKCRVHNIINKNNHIGYKYLGMRFMLYEFLKDNYKEAEPIFFSDIVIKGNRAFSESGG